jgi:hypothetical protein
MHLMPDTDHTSLRLPDEPDESPAGARSATGRRPQLRRDHLLLLAGAGLMTIGAFMPWLRGATRSSGTIDWSGLSDTGEGGMLIACAAVLLAFVRWRGILEEIEPRIRWLPLATGVAAGCLLLISFQKALHLSWWEIAPGARPQAGFLVCGIGIALTVGGGWLAARRRANAEIVQAAARREERVLAGRPKPPDPRVSADGYAVKARLDSRGRKDS